MDTRKGDLIRFKDYDNKIKVGLVFNIDNKFYVIKNHVDVHRKNSDGLILDKNRILNVTPREKVKEYWKYL